MLGKEYKSKKNKKFNIVIVGDATSDVFQDGDDESNRIAGLPGGIFFVKNMFEKVLNSEKVNVLGYKQTPKAEDMPNVIWKTKKVGVEGVFRCVETFDTRQSLAHFHKSCEQTISKNNKKKINMLVVNDLKLDGNKNNKWSEILGNLSENEEVGKNIPNLFIKVNRKLPDLTKGFYAKLMADKELKKKTVAIVFGDTLRAEGLTISKRISWERTAQDYLKEWYTHPAMKKLSEFKHQIVYFGISGAIHSYRIGCRSFHRLYFDTEHQTDIHRDPMVDGDVIGKQSIFITSILNKLVNIDDEEQNNEHEIAEKFGYAIKAAIVCIRKYYEHGLGDSFDKIQEFMEKGVFELVAKLLTEEEGIDKVADERIPVGNASWSIVNQSAAYNLLDVAVEIVLKGTESTLNKSSQSEKEPVVWAPIMKFGKINSEKLKVIDRRERESYNAVYRLLKKSIQSKSSNKRPLSIAVFGPPGSGKSFVVRELLNSARSEDCDIELQLINLSQLPDPDQLTKRLNKEAVVKLLEDEYKKLDEHAKLLDKLNSNTSGDDNQYLKDRKLKAEEDRQELQKKIDKLKEDKTKVCFFFDEFDSHLNGNTLGWLKYFLSPMEDGKWENPPIFIFAGGTSHNYKDFTREDSSIEKREQVEFAEAKGPDFVSRLLGHINILGPNPINDHDETYVLRRAVFLRSLILDHIFQDGNKKDEFVDLRKEKRIREDIIRAMLKVTAYKHGMRSIRAILDMSIKLGGDNGLYTSSTLPTLAQLNMHVDGSEFMNRLNEARIESSTRNQIQH